MSFGPPLKLEKNPFRSVHGLFEEGTQENAHRGNTEIMGELCVSLSFLPCYLANSINIKMSTRDEDYVDMIQSMGT